jgi:hypothetical protein
VVIAEGGAKLGIWGDGCLMTSRFEAHVAGRLPNTVAAMIAARFGEITTRDHRHSTVLSGHVTDQAALRSLLALIWDNGSSVRSFTLEPDPASRKT